MAPEERSTPTTARRTRRRWLMAAGLMQGLAMLFVMSGLVRLTPITMTFSVGAAGMLLGAACGIYVVTVALDLRHRRIL
jgi:hypothetical protein